MVRPEDLFTPGPAREARAPILVAHLDGSLDAGAAGALAVEQLLKTLNVQRVATFDSDELVDYRSHRPTMQVEDWVTTDVSEPEIAIDLIHDDQGQPVLLLHGPEPDAKWKTFTEAIRQIADDAGVEAVFTLHGLPAAVPHTRPSTVHVQSTEADLVPDQPLMAGIAQFPSPYTSYLQFKLSRTGRSGVSLLATVPYYMSGTTFPRASSALIRRLSEMAELSLPVGDLERGADEETGQVNELVEHNHDLQSTVMALEKHFDAIASGPTDGEFVADEDGVDVLRTAEDTDTVDWDRVMGAAPQDGSFPEVEQLNGETDESLADAIGEAIESYLRTHSKQKRRRDVDIRPGGSVNSENKHVPRHRASPPGEDDETPQTPTANDEDSQED
ncbi:PAC2 family protein [Actinomycetaceae bacterium MB13-C1-2]|nr:PAC2 family protein [Actinomycetaceae bacterium MB13-C1-2]